MLKTDNYAVDLKSDFQWELKLYNDFLCNSIIQTRLLKNSALVNKTNIVFQANQVNTLESVIQRSPLSVAQVAKMIRHISKQLSCLLEEESCTILGFHARDILVIDSNTYVYVGSAWVAPYNQVSGFASVTIPFTCDDFFLSPEMTSLTELPTPVHFKTCYYSLGCLILYAILGTIGDYQQLSPGELLDKVTHHPIKGTRIFWLLSRCFIEEPAYRSILLL